MREQTGPHQPHKDGSDLLALWRCDEASAVAFVDARGAYTTTAGTLPPAAGGLFTSPAGASGARLFNGSTQFATAPGDATATGFFATTTAKTGHGVAAWVRIKNLGTEQVIAAYGGQSELATGNTMWSFRVTAAGLLRVFCENGAGVDVNVDATGMTPLDISTNYHVGFARRTISATQSIIDFFVNGECVARSSAFTTPTTGGGLVSPLFALGRHQYTAEFTGYFDGTLDDIVVTKWDPSAAWFRDAYARGLRSFDPYFMRSSGFYETHVWVYVQWAGATPANGGLIDRGANLFTGGYLDMSDVFGHDHVVQVERTEDVDDQGQQATVKLLRNVFKQNISPGWGYGALSDATFMSLLQRVQICEANVPLGYGRAGAFPFRQVMFEGVIGDNVDWSRPELELRLTDRAAALQDTWVEDDAGGGDQQFSSGGGMASSVVMQDIIDSCQPSGGYKVNDDDRGFTGALGFSLYEPVAAAWNLPGPFNLPSTQNVMGALDEIARQRAWRCRMRWDDFRKEHRLTYYGPDRTLVWTNGAPDFSTGTVLDWSQLALGRADIRNVCDVEYFGTTTDNIVAPVRTKVTSTDAASVSLYGRRYCKIALASTNLIRDATRAQGLADAVVSDLRDPKANGVAETFHRTDVELEDVVKVRQDGLRFSADRDLAVVALRSVVGRNQRRTYTTLRGSFPIGRFRVWFDWGVVRKGHLPGKGKSAPTTPTGATVTAIADGIPVKWDYPVDLRNGRYRETEVHAYTSSGYTPSSSTLKALARGNHCVLKNLDNATTYYIKLIHRDEMGNVSAAGSAVSTKPRYMPKVPAVHASRSADVAIGTGKNELTAAKRLDTSATDYFNNYDDASVGRFVAPIDGLYMFEFSANVTFGAANTMTPSVELKRAGATVRVFTGATTAAGTDVNEAVSGVVFMAAGDELRQYCTGAAAMTLKANDKTFLAVSYLPTKGE